MTKQREVEQVAKLRAKMLGAPKAAARFELGSSQINWLGWIIGRAHDVKATKATQDETQIASVSLLGFFEGLPLNEELPVMRSDVCLLPGAVNAEIVKLVRQHQGAVIEFAYSVGTMRADNEQKYKYVTQVVGEPAVADPLDTLRAKVLKVKK